MKRLVHAPRASSQVNIITMTEFAHLSTFQDDGLPYDLSSLMQPGKVIDFSVSCFTTFPYCENGSDDLQAR